MYNLFDLRYNADAAYLDTPDETDSDLNLILGTDILEAQPEGSACITDEEAELLLPGYAIAFEEYHQHRSEGATPEDALQMTMKDWRKFWTAAAYVPHRPPVSNVA